MLPEIEIKAKKISPLLGEKIKLTD